MITPPDDPTRHSGPSGFPSFREWLDEREITDDDPPKATPAPQSEPVNEPPLIAPDYRAALSTLPLAAMWLIGAYTAPKLTTDMPFSALRLTGLALIGWGISLGCELSIAYRDTYPTWGMWEWMKQLRLSGPFTRIQRAAGKAASNGAVSTLLAACAVPGLFAAFYVFFAALSVAVHILITAIAATAVTHIAVTITRHQRKGA